MSGIENRAAALPKEIIVGFAIGAGCLLGMEYSRWKRLAANGDGASLQAIKEFISELLYVANANTRMREYSNRLDQLVTTDREALAALIADLNEIYLACSDDIDEIDDLFYDKGISYAVLVSNPIEPMHQLLYDACKCLEIFEEALQIGDLYSTACRNYLDKKSANSEGYSENEFRQILKPICELCLYDLIHTPKQLFFQGPTGECSLLIPMRNVDFDRTTAYDDLLIFLEDNPKLTKVVILGCLFATKHYIVLRDVLDLLQKNCRTEVLILYFNEDIQEHREITATILAQIRLMTNLKAAQLFDCNGQIVMDMGLKYKAQIFAMQSVIKAKALRYILAAPESSTALVPYKPRPES